MKTGSTVSPRAPRVVTWQVIQLGNTVRSGAHLYRILQTMNVAFTEWAEAMLRHKDFAVEKVQQGVALYRISVGKLGFTERARYDAICKRASEGGLELCHQEDGPQLCLQLQKKLKKMLFVAMKPLVASDGSLQLFCLQDYEGRRLLGSYYGAPNQLFDPDDEFVFRKRPK